MKHSSPANSNEALTNVALPFMIEASGIRGRFIRLNEELHSILSGHRYPTLVSSLLGELLVLASMLGSMLKLNGMLSIQIQGNGPVDFLSADYTSQGHLRGYAQIRDRKAIANLPELPGVATILGKGHIVITIETLNERPYQAIVPLEGTTLSECITNFLRQSDQLDAVMHSAVTKTGKRWHAGGIVLQRIPTEGGKPAKKKQTPEDRGWETACTLLATVTHKELADHRLPLNTLLYRLFHEDGVRVFPPQKLKAQCRCSREKMVNVLRSLSSEEIQDMTVKGVITVTCKFCSNTLRFKEGDW